jgi:hypothetical protein
MPNNLKKVWLLEQSTKPLPIKELKVDENGVERFIFRGPCAYFNEYNDNERFYSKEDYLPHLDYLKKQIKERSLLGSSDHNEDFIVSMKDVSHVINDLWYDEEKEEVWIEIELIPTINGNGVDIIEIVKKGVPLFISSRATGYLDDDGKVTIDTIYTYDIVYRPGFRRAKLTRITEGLKPLPKNVAIYEWVSPKSNELDIKDNKINNNKEIQENMQFVTKEDFNNFANSISKILLEMKSNNISEKKDIHIPSGKAFKKLKLNEDIDQKNLKSAISEYKSLLAQNPDSPKEKIEETVCNKYKVELEKLREAVNSITITEVIDTDKLKELLSNDSLKAYSVPVIIGQNVYDYTVLVKGDYKLPCDGSSVQSDNTTFVVSIKFNREATLDLELDQEINKECKELTTDEVIDSLKNSSDSTIFDSIMKFVENSPYERGKISILFENEEDIELEHYNSFKSESVEELINENKELRESIKKLTSILESQQLKINELVDISNKLIDKDTVNTLHVNRLEEAVDEIIKTTNTTVEAVDEIIDVTNVVTEATDEIIERTNNLLDKDTINTLHVNRLEDAVEELIGVANLTIEKFSKESDTESIPAKNIPVEDKITSTQEADSILESVMKKRAELKLGQIKNQYSFLNSNISESTIKRFSNLSDADKNSVSRIIGNETNISESYLISVINQVNPIDSILMSGMPSRLIKIWESLDKTTKNNIINLSRTKILVDKEDAEMFWESLGLDTFRRVNGINESLEITTEDTPDVLGYSDDEIKI